MENNQNNRPGGEQQKKHPATEGGHHRNRRRHSHRPNRPKNNDGEKAASTGGTIDKSFFTPGEGKPAAPAPAPAEKKQASQNQGNQNQNNQNKKNKPGNGEKQKDSKDKNRNHQRNRNRHHRSNEHSPYNPYEEVRPEELSLEELRARIVVKSADAQENTKSPSAMPSPVLITDPPAEEAVEPLNVDHILNPEPPAETEPVKKEEVVGIRFRTSGKMYYFDPRGLKIKKGEQAIVETARGAEFGDVCMGNTMVNADRIVTPLRPVLRVATPEDIRHDAENREKEKQALSTCQERILAHKLEMKLIDVQYAFDNSKLLFYFTADGRIDFRDLVKDLASVFRTRIELRQIGIRDEAKILGGLGACGRPLCCSTFLPDFAQVSIKMAKDQNLSLNSAKISGVCGRLMCCLRYESEVYAEEIRLTPGHDTVVKTEDGIGTVISSNPLAGTIRVILKDAPDTPPKQYHRSAVTVIGKNNRENGGNKGDSKESKEKK